MKVEQACRLSADGTARTKEKLVTRDGSIVDVLLYAKFNEIQGRYTVTQYINREKTVTARQFVDPHKFDDWRPSRRFTTQEEKRLEVKTEFCLYLLVSKDKYHFNLGITDNIYSTTYKLRLLCGEFDLESSVIVYGEKERLKKLEGILSFTFEEYRRAKNGSNEDESENWFNLDCFWYAKNEIRRLNSFREEKIFRIFEGIDLNAFIVEDVNKLTKYANIDLN